IWTRPFLLSNPTASPLCVVGGRAGAVHYVEPVGRLSRNASLFPFEELVPPSQGFLQEPNRRSRDALVRIQVRPRSHRDLVRSLKLACQAQRAVRVGTG